MSKNITVKLNQGLDGLEIDFIHMIEKSVDKALTSLGFTREGTTKGGKRISLYYVQFGACATEEQTPGGE